MWRIVAMAAAIQASVVSAEDLKSQGVLGFPQQSARQLCDTEELRVSAVADGSYLYVQAVMWGDHENTAGKEGGIRESKDKSTLCLDLDGDGERTKGMDRVYHLNTSDGTMPLSFSESLGGSNWTAASKKTEARGCIRFFSVNGRKVRVDSIAIPLKELGIKPNSSIGLAFYGRSFSPDKRYSTVSVSGKASFDYFHLPWDKFDKYALGVTPMGLDISELPAAK